jgi:hypothetical protein
MARIAGSLTGPIAALALIASAVVFAPAGQATPRGDIGYPAQRVCRATAYRISQTLMLSPSGNGSGAHAGPHQFIKVIARPVGNHDEDMPLVANLAGSRHVCRVTHRRRADGAQVAIFKTLAHAKVYFQAPAANGNDPDDALGTLWISK